MIFLLITQPVAYVYRVEASDKDEAQRLFAEGMAENIGTYRGETHRDIGIDAVLTEDEYYGG